MFAFIKDIPTKKKIASVHCIPITENGTIMMAWDEEERLLTTIGGRVEGEEKINLALDREVMEEAGITIQDIETNSELRIQILNEAEKKAKELEWI